MDPLLKRLWETYGGAVADTAGGVADMATTAGLAGQFIANPMLAAHLHRQTQGSTGAMQRSVPQPRNWQDQAARVVTGMAVPIPGPKGVNQVANGAGRVMYHGGAKLSKEYPNLTYFTDAIEGAKDYIKYVPERFGAQGHLNKANVRINNPAPQEALRDAFREEGWDIKNRVIDGSFLDGEVNGHEFIRRVVDRLKAKGFDGVVSEDGVPGQHLVIKSYLPFDHSQWDLLD